MTLFTIGQTVQDSLRGKICTVKWVSANRVTCVDPLTGVTYEFDPQTLNPLPSAPYGQVLVQN